MSLPNSEAWNDPEFEALVERALREIQDPTINWKELFPDPTPQQKAEIDKILGPDFAERVRNKTRTTTTPTAPFTTAQSRHG